MRLIDADALILWTDNYYVSEKFTVAHFANMVKDMPTIEERKTGKWTVKEGELAFWDVCSVCRKKIMHRTPHYNFCPNCGADMRGDKQ